MDRHTVVDVMIIFERADGRLLLAERARTGYADGQLNLPSGKVEPGESVLQAAIRETREEVAVHLTPEQLRVVHVMHRRNAPGAQSRVGWFFAASRWEGHPVNAEPHKCAGISWHPAYDLPANTVPYNALGIAHYLNGDPFSIYGW